MPLPLPSLAGLPATPPTGHTAEQAETLIGIIEDITRQLGALNAKVRELEKRQKAFETQFRHGHGPTSPPHDSGGGGAVLWGSGGGGE